MFANNYISTIVENQLPEFIRSDHPNFVALFKRYYEYLEQNGKTLNVNKQLYDYMDVDTTRSDLIQYFKSKIIPNFPEQTELSTAKIVKAARDFYTKKGTPDSFKFIFRVLYGQEADVYFPKEDILRASDGKWKQPQSLRLSFSDTSTLVTGGNVNVAGATANVVSANGINLVTKGITVNSYIRIGDHKRKVINVHPTGANLLVEIPFANTSTTSLIYDSQKLFKITLSEYTNFNTKLLEKRQGIGEISRTTCIIEKAALTIDEETGREIVELYISNVKRLFESGENLIVPYVDENGNNKTFKSKIVSLISNLTLFRNRFGVVQTGRKYVTGDPVVIYGGLADSPDAVKAIAVVNNVSTGSIESVDLINAGYLFRETPDSLIRVNSTSGVGANVLIAGIWDDVANSATIEFNTDSILYRNDIFLNDPDGYDFDNVTAYINLTSGSGNTTTSVNLNTATYVANTTTNYYNGYLIRVVAGLGSDGSGSKVNTAYINSYSGTTKIAQISPLRAVRGTVNITSGSAVVTGNTTGANGTAFLSDAIQGHYTYLQGKNISIDGQVRNVVSVTNDFSLTVNAAFTVSNTNTKLFANSQLTVAPGATSNLLITVGSETPLSRAFSYDSILLGKIRSLDLKDGGSFFQTPPTFDAISLHDSDYSLDQQFFVIPKGNFSDYNPNGNPPSIRLSSSTPSYSLANGFYTGTRLFLDVGDTAHYATVVDYVVTNPATSANVKTIYLDKKFENNINPTNILNYNLFFDFRPDVRGSGKLGTLLLKKGGTGYSVTDNVVFVGTGYGANAYLTVSGGVITAITMDNRGEGYSAPPTILIKNGANLSTGTGAELEVLLLSDGEELVAGTGDIGRIQDFKIINRGFDYANTPVVSLKVADILTDNLAAGKIILEGDYVWQGGITNVGATFSATVDGSYRPDSTNTAVIRVFNYSGSIDTTQPLKVATVGGNLTLNISTQNAIISFNDTNDAVERKYPFFYGDGLAKANAEFLNGLIKYSGFYLNTDGFLSADKKLENKDYYHNFSYEISSEKSLDEYKETINRVAHPAGMHLLSKYIAKNIVANKNTIKSNVHISNDLESTNANTSFSSNIFYGNVASQFNSTVNIGDIVVINTTATEQFRRYSRLVANVVNNTTLWLESPIGGLGDGKIRTTSSCNEIVVYSNSSAVTESIKNGDNIRFKITNTTYDRQIVSISGNTVTLNATVPQSGNVLYTKIPSYNVVGFDIIRTNG